MKKKNNINKIILNKLQIFYNIINKFIYLNY